MKKLTSVLAPLVVVLTSCGSTGVVTRDVNPKMPEGGVKVAETETQQTYAYDIADVLANLGFDEKIYAFEGNVNVEFKSKGTGGLGNGNGEGVVETSIKLSSNIYGAIDFTRVYELASVENGEMFMSYIPSVALKVTDFNLSVHLKHTPKNGDVDEINLEIKDLTVGVYFDSPTFNLYMDLSDKSVKTNIESLVTGLGLVDVIDPAALVSSLGTGRVCINVMDLLESLPSNPGPGLSSLFIWGGTVPEEGSDGIYQAESLPFIVVAGTNFDEDDESKAEPLYVVDKATKGAKRVKATSTAGGLVIASGTDREQEAAEEKYNAPFLPILPRNEGENTDIRVKGESGVNAAGLIGHLTTSRFPMINETEDAALRMRGEANSEENEDILVGTIAMPVVVGQSEDSNGRRKHVVSESEDMFGMMALPATVTSQADAVALAAVAEDDSDDSEDEGVENMLGVPVTPMPVRNDAEDGTAKVYVVSDSEEDTKNMFGWIAVPASVDEQTDAAVLMATSENDANGVMLVTTDIEDVSIRVRGSSNGHRYGDGKEGKHQHNDTCGCKSPFGYEIYDEIGDILGVLNSLDTSYYTYNDGKIGLSTVITKENLVTLMPEAKEDLNDVELSFGLGLTVKDLSTDDYKYYQLDELNSPGYYKGTVDGTDIDLSFNNYLAFAYPEKVEPFGEYVSGEMSEYIDLSALQATNAILKKTYTIRVG